MITKQSNKLNVYDAPCIKVVSFTVEQGFAGSNYRSEPLAPSADNRALETVDQASSNGTLDGFFR